MLFSSSSYGLVASGKVFVTSHSEARREKEVLNIQLGVHVGLKQAGHISFLKVVLYAGDLSNVEQGFRGWSDTQACG